MTTTPDLRAQGLITSYRDLGSAMSQRPRRVRELRRPGAANSAAKGESATESQRDVLRRVGESVQPAT